MTISRFEFITGLLALIPYSARLGFLALLLALIAFFDWRRNREKARRWREYLYLIAAGAIGALFMLAFDEGTALISRDYYSLSKGFEERESFYSQLTALSLMTGLPSGFIVGALYLAANNPKPDLPGIPLNRLLRFLLYPIVCTIIVAPFTAAFFVSADPLGHGAFYTASHSSSFSDPSTIQHLLVAQGINVGLYIGAFIGAVWAVIHIRMARRITAAASTPPSTPPPAQPGPNPP